MSSANEIRDLNKIYMEAVYGGKKEEGKKATPESGTGKYYDEKKPTAQQLANRAKREKIKSLTNQGKHKEASALHNEDAKYGYDKDGNSLNPVDIEKRKKKDDDLAGSPNYETKKKAEVLSAMKKQGRKLSDKEKSKIADKVVKDKGDTSKSDDRYAYEELTHLRALVEKEVVAKKEIKDLQKAGKTLKGKNVAKADALLDEYIPEKEVKVKDTRRVVDAIRAYDKSKDASRDATYDTDEGDKEKAAIEKKYAAKERGEIDKDDPNWKKRKYHTGIHGEEVEILKGLLESGKLSEEEVKSILWNEGYQRDPEQQEKERKTSKQTDPSKDNFTGIGDSIADIMKQNAAMKAAAKKKTKKEGYQRNPEKGEEEERKAEKRRKESGRMPPRGDKRREEFERWYAANVR